MADLPNPKGRKELYEYNATQGITENMPEPKSREELYLKTLAEQGGGGGGGGTTNYNQLSNKPKINNVELSGNKTTQDLIPIGNGLKFNEEGELESTGSGSGAVESVNGKTGEVELNAQDVGALPADTEIPDSTSDLNNDSGFIDNTADNLLNYYLKTETYAKAEVDTALTSKVDKVTGKGLSTNDYTDADKAEVAKVVDKADSEDVINNASYDSANHLILFKNDETTLFSLDAAAFVKDGMIDNVEITGGNLVITFNTDAGKQDISIPLTDIFDPANYYNKTATDDLLADKADETEIADIVNVYGAKNLLPYPYQNTTATVNGVTFTDNGDGTITCNGTATALINYHLHSRDVGEINDFIIKNGTYIVTGTPVVQGNYGIGVDVTKNGVGVNLGNEVGNGITVTFDGSDNTPSGYSNVQIRIFIRQGTTLDNVTFKPMIRCASISDDTYVPYVLTNKDLTYNNKTVTGRNLITYPYYSASGYTNNGITYTINADGSITANGTATADSNFYLTVRTLYNNLLSRMGKGTFTLSGCPSGGGVNKYQIWMNYGDASQSIANIGGDTGNGLTFTINSDISMYNLQMFIHIESGQTVNNITFKPMLEEGITAHAYEPTTETALTMRNSIAPVEDGVTASETRNAGTYIMRKGQLYRVTQTIASGAAITEGVNIVATTIKEIFGDLIIAVITRGTSINVAAGGVLDYQIPLTYTYNNEEYRLFNLFSGGTGALTVLPRYSSLASGNTQFVNLDNTAHTVTPEVWGVYIKTGFIKIIAPGV